MADASATADDPYLWLEEVDGAQARAWVEARNAETKAALCDAQFERDRGALLDLLNAPDRIPWIGQRGRYVYNFWQDEQHPKGLWRRTTMARYRSDDPQWEVLLDIDALARAENENWVWRGCVALPPEHRRGLVQLSRGGADAAVSREFDLEAKRFVDGGFVIPETNSAPPGATPTRSWWLPRSAAMNMRPAPAIRARYGAGGGAHRLRARLSYSNAIDRR